ncbi:hypothetical protein UPYG_G00102540 [Umbra pygmaea]|uniref:Phosphoinositide 3-kinase regulatory subunit 6 n=1 Tax=Umbra pygmaea TaxID=75934 RepID=A0ABD0XQT0_UMBPY
MSSVDSTMYNSIRAILTQASSSCNKGMLRWTLHKKVENQPSKSISLVRVLVKELEKVELLDHNMHIIPLLHTIFYVIIQSGHIPENLQKRVYECFKRLLTHPEPYCAIALRYMGSIKMELITPGALYVRRVIAEHSLRNNHFPQQEKVLVFADPAVLSGPLWQGVRADLELACPSSDTLTKKRLVLLHSLQTGLLKACHGPTLTQALEDLDEDLEHFFQEVVLALEQSIENHDQYPTKLQKIYSEILRAANQDPKTEDIHSTAPLPSPVINFHIWTNEEELWNELENFSVNLSDQKPMEQEYDEDVSRRVSVLSVDSGIGKDLLNTENGEEMKSPAFRGKVKPEDIMASESEQNHTARVVVMGDDRVLGRLAKVYHHIRKRAAKHILFSKRVKLEIYYIPVTDEPVINLPESTSQVRDMLSVASFLGKIDPWYESNINSLGTVIPKLAVTKSSHSSSSEPNHFLVDVLSYYLRCGCQPIHLPLYSVKISISGQDDIHVEEIIVCHLEAELPDFKTLKENLKQEGSNRRRIRKSLENCGAVVSVNYTKVSLSKHEFVKGMSVMTNGVVISTISEKDLDFLTVNFDSPNSKSFTEIRTQNISIQILEDKTFDVCIDKDSRRTYTNVKRIEITPCLDPVNCPQIVSKSTEGETFQSNYFSKILPLPINTFAGINH